MTQANCPSCGEVIDPKHAPIARIRGAKIVTYCSTRCADSPQNTGAESGGSAPPPKPERESKTPAPKFKMPEVARPVSPRASEPRKVEPPPRIATPISDDASRSVGAHARGQGGAARAKPGSTPPPVAAKGGASGSVSGTIGAESALGGGDVVDAADQFEASLKAGRKKKIILVAAAVLFVGAALAIVEIAKPGDNGSAAVTTSETTASEPAKEVGASVAAAPEDEPAADEQQAAATDGGDQSARMRRAAETALRELLSSPSARIQRLAALALARGNDKQALELLRKLLEQENSELARLEVAYGLARSGDKAGRAALVAGLESDRRDVRLDAARALVALGDDAGRDELRQMLGNKRQKLGAAALLARLEDPKGSEALIEVWKSKKSSPAARMRAAVALGRAGDKSVKKELTRILKEGRYAVGAADALAALGEPEAIPALERQLALTGVRVQAALRLRRLDRSPDMTVLAEAIAAGDEVSRVGAAEAVLILTGPREAAARD